MLKSAFDAEYRTARMLRSNGMGVAVNKLCELGHVGSICLNNRRFEAFTLKKITDEQNNIDIMNQNELGSNFSKQMIKMRYKSLVIRKNLRD